MAKWIIHLMSGETLTDEHCFPHEVDSETVTSVERVIRGKHLTIKKSPFIEDFFIATEEGIDVRMGTGPQAPPTITKRIIGCYVKRSDPPIQCRLTMDPRTFNTVLEFFAVKKKTKKGINARRVKPKKKGQLDLVHQKNTPENVYTIIQSPEIVSAFNTPIGLGCVLKKPKVRAELVIHGQNVLLGFTAPHEKLKIV